MNRIFRAFLRTELILLLMVPLLATVWHAQAQPTILSVSPADGTTGVATTSTVVFTFSTGMFTTATTVIFTNANTGAYLAASTSWNPAGTVLTCSPVPSFPANSVITWYVIGFNSSFQQLTGTVAGSFTTGSSGSSSGSGTNKITTFLVAKIYNYIQTSTGAPMLNTNVAYLFEGDTTLASNRTATSISLTLPSNSVSNLTENLYEPENYSLLAYETNQTDFESKFPQGNYTFNVQATASNQTVTVNFPTSVLQPNAPHLTNFTAAQSIVVTQAFKIGWDAFTGGTASDYILLSIYGGSIAFQTGVPGSSNALAGTARSVSIPANTLKPGTTYAGYLDFYKILFVTNNAVNVSIAYRSSATAFSLTAAANAGGPLTFSNILSAGGAFSFDLLCAPGQTVTILSSTNPTLPVAQWSVVLTTNSLGSSIHFSDPRAAIYPSLFYRGQNGP